MIIFFNKKSGNIVGTIEGRINGEDHLRMWIGSTNENGRIVCQWKQKGDGEFEPESPQKEIFIEIDKNPSKIYKYKVNIVSNLLEAI